VLPQPSFVSPALLFCHFVPTLYYATALAAELLLDAAEVAAPWPASPAVAVAARVCTPHEMRVEEMGDAGMVVVVGPGIRKCEWAERLGVEISKSSCSRSFSGAPQQGVVIEGGVGW